MKYAYECFLELKRFKLEDQLIVNGLNRDTDNLFTHISDGVKFTGYAACFDLDWTLTRPVRGLFPKDGEDITPLPRRVEILKKLQNSEWTLVIFTNQLSRGKKSRENILGRLNKIIGILESEGLKIILFAALADDEFRKPSIGMWNELTEIVGGVSTGFYVGDSAGRPQDRNDSDKLLAQRVTSQVEFFKFFTPEQFFPPVTAKLPANKSFVIMMGLQGSGKSTYARSLKDHVAKRSEYVVIENDRFKGNKNRIKKAVVSALETGENVVVDGTHPTREHRMEYYDLAKSYGYTPTTIYMVRNGDAFNKLRETPVPKIAQYVYLKKLEEPGEGENFYQIDRI